MAKNKSGKNKVKQPKALSKRDFLTMLARTKDKKRRKTLIEIANSSEIKAISECILNFLSGRIKVPQSYLASAQAHKNSMRLIANRRPSIKEKKKVLIEKGDFLPKFLPFALKTISNLKK